MSALSSSVKCVRCNLYLGRTAEVDFPVHVICPLCDEERAGIEHALGRTAIRNENRYPNERAMSWFGDLMSRDREAAEAVTIVRLIVEERECDFYEFPPLHARQNGSLKR